MKQLTTETLSSFVASRIAPLIEEIIASGHSSNLHSVYVVGSALTPDFDEKRSDINSIIVLREMDLEFVEFMAPLGKRYKKRSLAAPLIMTPEYVKRSLDVFPIEFFNFKLLHELIYGSDVFTGITIGKNDLRLQAEREVKIKLIALRQGYISSLGDKKLIVERLSESITGYIPLFRAILHLMGEDPPDRFNDILSSIKTTSQIDTSVFRKMLGLKKGEVSLSKEELTTVFEEFYMATERIGDFVDELES